LRFRRSASSRGYVKTKLSIARKKGYVNVEISFCNSHRVHGDWCGVGARRLDPQKIDSMTRNCVYNNAFYSQGAIVCLGAGRGLQCSAGNWIITQDAASCREQVPAQPPLLR
jgi:hypothetical protein